MQLIIEILEDANFDEWSEIDQRMLSTLMFNLASHERNESVIATASTQVCETYTKILNMHIRNMEN